MADQLLSTLDLDLDGRIGLNDFLDLISGKENPPMRAGGNSQAEIISPPMVSLKRAQAGASSLG